MKLFRRLVPITVVGLAPIVSAFAQGTAADYARANGLRAKYESLVVDVAGPATWIDDTHRFWYRRTTRGASEFVLYDADTGQKRPAFDHEAIAKALSKASGHTYGARELPFNTFAFADGEHAIDVTVDGTSWRCVLADAACRHEEPRGERRDDTRPRPSPDKKWEAVVQNYNIAIRPAGTRG